MTNPCCWRCGGLGTLQRWDFDGEEYETSCDWCGPNRGMASGPPSETCRLCGVEHLSIRDGRVVHVKDRLCWRCDVGAGE